MSEARRWPRVAWDRDDAPAPREVLVASAILALACILFFHGYEIFNFTLSIDEELNLGGETALDYLQQGRWAVALRTWLLMADTTVPIAAIATGLALYAAAFVLLVRHFRIKRWQAVAVAAPVFFGFPVLVYDVAFSNIALTLGLGSLAAALALLAADTPSRSRLLLAGLAIAFATALYQSLFYLVLVFFTADLVRRVWPGDAPLDAAARKLVLWYCAVILAGLVLYFLISFALLASFNVRLIYVTIYLKPEIAGSDPAGVVASTAAEIGNFLAGTNKAFLHHAAYYRIFMALVAALLVWRVAATARRSPSLAFAVGLLLLAIVAAPFLQHPLNGGHMPYRTLLALPAALALPTLFAGEFSPPRLLTFILIPLAGLVAIEFSWISNRQYYGGHWALERDTAVANQIVDRIGRLRPNQNPYTVAFVGRLPRKKGPLVPRVPDTTVGASFFEWDGGNTHRAVSFLNIVSDWTFREADMRQARAAFEAAVSMPSWPADGSVAQAGDVIVVKLSNPNRIQLAPFCVAQTDGICSPASWAAPPAKQ